MIYCLIYLYIQYFLLHSALDQFPPPMIIQIKFHTLFNITHFVCSQMSLLALFLFSYRILLHNSSSSSICASVEHAFILSETKPKICCVYRDIVLFKIYWCKNCNSFVNFT